MVKKNTPLQPGDTEPGRKVGAPGTRNNPKIKRDSKGNQQAEIIDSKHDPKNKEK